MIAEIRRIRKIGFRFDALSVYLLCEHHGVELDEIDKIDKEEYLPSWIWCAYKSWCMFRYRKPRIGYKRMKKILARLRMNEWRVINDAMIKSRGPGGDEKKKEQAGTTSSSQATGLD